MAFTKTATHTHTHNEGRLRTHSHLAIGAPERVCPVAPCRGRTGPRPEVLEKRSAFGLTGAWRQFLYLTCDTARGQRWVLAYTTRQTHQEALALASATPVQPSLSAPPSVGHCLSSRVPMTDFTFFLTFVIHTEFIPEPCLVFFLHLEHYDIIGKQSLGLYRMKTLCLVF